MRLSEDIWRALLEILKREKLTLSDLLTRLDRERASVSLSAATRAFVVRYLRTGTTTFPRHAPDILLETEERFASILMQRSLIERGLDFERKLQLCLGAIPEIEEGATLRCWEDWVLLRSSRGATPDLTSFLELNSARYGGAEGCGIIDTTPENPFQFQALESSIPFMSMGSEIFTQKPIGAFPVPLKAQILQTDYNAVKMTMTPHFHIIRQRRGDGLHTYTRVLLPFSSTGGSIDRLLTVVR